MSYVICIVSTQMLYAYSCVRTWKLCPQLSHLNNTQHSYLNKMNPWENKFCMTIIAKLWPMKFVILATNDQPLKWVMHVNWFVGKLARWDFILWENDFDVKHWARTINEDANGLNRKSSSSDLDIIGTYSHEETNLEMMHGWHVISFFYILAKWLPKGIMSSSREFFRHFGVFKGGTWWHYTTTKHVFCIGFLLLKI